MYHQTTWKNTWLLCHEKHLQFFDRFQSMSSSIDKLASNLPDEAYRYTSKVFKSETFKLMRQKGVYPHDYMSSFDKFNKKQLVTKDEFYSILSDEHISDDQCKHVQNVWNTSNLKTMGDYHDFHTLDPCHYFTIPGLPWDDTVCQEWQI